MAVRKNSSGAVQEKSFKEIWLSDPGTYPVIGIISFACLFCGGYYSYNILTNPDIRITKGKRRDTVIRNWSR
eukprot:CAMPEP_0118987068 /NCGR_PEP_ID=MMETSP1173-20130426/43436_1 /TAXON_ID=1034831 /ORGANISM="Rhizochromulina marina cf, Strain CCMP1243" /LENGTH=71 /DNA_ID=CAMNT_0006937893 /DNA_START=47 /DNA_END=262 /DNA_ORIENTATION=+